MESIGKGNLCIVVICMAKTNKQTNNQQRLQNVYTDQNRKKYETIIEEITLQLTQVM
jgi:hypothetical protein